MPKVNAKPQTVIKGIKIYKNDIFVVREKKRNRGPEQKRGWYKTPEGEIFTSEGLRQPIEKLTKKSQKLLAFTASNTEVEFDRMITLTYPDQYPIDGSVCKRHLHAMLAWLRRRGMRDYLWFLEFQKRGAPHYHILISNKGVFGKDELSKAWYAIVGSDDKRHLLAGTRIERGRKKGGLHRYAVKYAQKARQKNVPKEFVNTGRFWSCSKSVRPSSVHDVPVDCEHSLSVLLRDWKHKGKEAEGYNVLFGAAEPVRKLLVEYGYFRGGVRE